MSEKTDELLYELENEISRDEELRAEFAKNERKRLANMQDALLELLLESAEDASGHGRSAEEWLAHTEARGWRERGLELENDIVTIAASVWSS